MASHAQLRSHENIDEYAYPLQNLFVLFALATAVVAHSSVLPALPAYSTLPALVRTSDDVSSFSYDVADPYTGDYKSQTETRVGDTVRGQYSLLESDGTQRVVDYTAGDEGFNAVVRKDPAVLPAAPAVVAAPAATVVAQSPAIVEEPVVVEARKLVTPSLYSGSLPSLYPGSHTLLAPRTLLQPSLYNAGHALAPSNSLLYNTAAPSLYSHSLLAPSAYSPYTPYSYNLPYGLWKK